MYGLTVVESGLVPVYEDSEQRTVVNARELHQALSVGRDFSTWIKDRLKKYKFSRGEDYEVFPHSGENPNGGRPTTEYLLTIDTAKEIAMVENNHEGKQVRRYFIECEKRLRNNESNGRGSHIPYQQHSKGQDTAWLLNQLMLMFNAEMSEPDKLRIANHITYLLTGEVLVTLPEMESLYSASELGEMFGVDAYTIGIIANKAKLKSPIYGVWVPTTFPDKYNRTRIFQYNEAGKERIRKLIKDGK